METPNASNEDRNLCHESVATEAMNEESDTEKIRQIIEEWNEQGETSNLNKFKSPVKNTLSIKQAQPSDE